MTRVATLRDVVRRAIADLDAVRAGRRSSVASPWVT